MPRVALASFLTNVYPAAGGEFPGATVREVLDHLFASAPGLRTYVLDDQGAMRKHVTVFLDSTPVTDRDRLSDTVRPDSELFIMQALSGG
jgi:molybdopterin synthase sulfur carrier subunit